MQLPRFLRLKGIAMAAVLCAGSAVWAADPITDAMQSAYGPYRMALYKTNGTSQSESREALLQAQQGWEKVAAQFGAKPVAPYDRDPAFAASVAEVAKVYAKALDEINANQLKAAHNTLEHARDVMSTMRQRNQVVVFSDHMNAYHEVMEHVLDDGEAHLAKPKGLLLVAAQTGALAHLAKRLGTQAPATLAANPEFATLLKAVEQSVAQLEAAVLKEDASAVKEAISKLKVPYSKLFAKFG